MLPAFSCKFIGLLWTLRGSAVRDKMFGKSIKVRVCYVLLGGHLYGFLHRKLMFVQHYDLSILNALLFFLYAIIAFLENRTRTNNIIFISISSCAESKWLDRKDLFVVCLKNYNLKFLSSLFFIVQTTVERTPQDSWPKWCNSASSIQTIEKCSKSHGQNF